MVYIDQHYKLCRLLLLLVGQWPDDRSNLKYLSRILITFPIASSILIQIFGMNAVKWQFDVILQMVPLFMFPVACALKYAICWVQKTMVKRLFNHVKYDWDALQSENEVQLMTRYSAKGYLYGKLYAVYVFSAVFGFIALMFMPIMLDVVVPLNTSRVRMLHLEKVYAVKLEENYHLIILHLQSMIVAGGTAAAASDILYISMTFHVCGMYNIIRYRMEHVFDDAEYFSSSRKVHVFRARIMQAVDYHLKCIEQLRHISSCFIVSYVLQLFVIVIAIASLLVNIQACWTTGKNLLALMFTLDLVGHYFLVFLIIVPSQNIVNYSTDVNHSTYCGRWYDAPISTRKLILFVMLKTQKPETVHAKNVFDVSFMFFGTIVRISFSYFMFLASLQE